MIIYVYLLFHKAPQIIKIVILVNLSPIFLALTLSILAWKFAKSHAFPIDPKLHGSFSVTQPICCFPASVRQNTPIPYWEPNAKVLRKLIPFQSLQLLF